MKKLIMMVVLMFVVCLSAYSQTSLFAFMPQNHQGTQFMQIKVLSSLSLNLHSKFGELSELSGIAWDNDENVLYAVTDEGLLHHLSLKFNRNNQLVGVNLLDSFELKSNEGKALTGNLSDAEGLDLLASNNGIKGDSQLVIAFERAHRVARFSPTGKPLGHINIPLSLTNKTHYQSANKGMETVAIHPEYGVLVATELPLKKANHQTIYAMNGRSWRFALSGVANSSITGSEVLPNGNILLLERSWSGLLAPIIIALRELDLTHCLPKQLCKTREVATFSSSEGWLLDNFEGLTHIKGNRYLMVSDDNQNPFQSTVMVLFEYL